MKTEAEQGDAEAQHVLGFSYQEGRDGLPQDYEKAAYWYRKAAEQGFAFAQSVLGLKYHIGEGVEQNDEMAVEWYRKAAEQGDDVHQIMLDHVKDHGH